MVARLVVGRFIFEKASKIKHAKNCTFSHIVTYCWSKVNFKLLAVDFFLLLSPKVWQASCGFFLAALFLGLVGTSSLRHPIIFFSAMPRDKVQVPDALAATHRSAFFAG